MKRPASKEHPTLPRGDIADLLRQGLASRDHINALDQAFLEQREPARRPTLDEQLSRKYEEIQSRDLIGVGRDHHLSFKEIARAWSKVSGDKPEMLIEALVAAFWLGEFESGGHSTLFMLLKPDSPALTNSAFERRPGDYRIQGGVFVRLRGPLSCTFNYSVQAMAHQALRDE
jgi:hypothetical protein